MADKAYWAESGFPMGAGRISILLVALAILFAASMSPAQEPEGPAEILAGVAEFENSPFCRKYECRLDSIEPLRFRGLIECWFYNYLHYGDNVRPPTQFGLRLSNAGDRTTPYMILRWFPVTKIQDIDFVATRDYLQDIIGDQAERVIPFVRGYAKARLINKQNRKSGPVAASREMKIEDFTFSCTYTPGKPPRYPQFTLMVTSVK